MKSRIGVLNLCLFGLLPSAVLGWQDQTATTEVTFVRNDGRVEVTIGGEPFTKLDFGTYAKPILYPIFAPSQIAMTRDWPMKSDTLNESHDHPHHKSMWASHEINGVDFWTEKGGVVKTTAIETEFADETDNAILTKSQWVKRTNSQTVLSGETVYWFGGDQNSRWINCLAVFAATHGDIQFEDTKEGLFAIRTHPDLRLTADAKAGVNEVFGNAINSAGVTGKNVWGKRSKWLLYFGSIDGYPVSVAMYDHPANLRHPTTWHARDYGLIAANPFGLHDFLRQQKGAGIHRVGQGDTLELRYRVEFFNAIVTPETIERKFHSFANESLLRPTSQLANTPTSTETDP